MLRYFRDTCEIRGGKQITEGSFQTAAGKIDMLFCQGVPWCGGVVHSRRANFFKAVHILLTILPSHPASGLRLEIVINIDKKKPQFYFCRRLKKS
jgi:hypothetical protein